MYQSYLQLRAYEQTVRLVDRRHDNNLQQKLPKLNSNLAFNRMFFKVSHVADDRIGAMQLGIFKYCFTSHFSQNVDFSDPVVRQNM